MSAPSNNPAGAAPGIDEALMPKRVSFVKWAAARGLDVSEDRDAWGRRKFAQSHIEAMWDGWFNAPAATPIADTALTDLRDHLAAAQLAGAPITLSPEAAGALHRAMTTDAPQYAEDPVDIIRTLLCAVDGYHRRTSSFEPSPIANNSPVILAARRACVERGFTAGGLAVAPTPSGDA